MSLSPPSNAVVTSTATAVLSTREKQSRRAIMQILSEIRDPGVPMTLVEMGIIDEDHIQWEGENLRVYFRPSSPFCPLVLALGVVIKYALEEELGTEVKVRMVRGSHLQESLVNELLGDRRRYLKALKRLKSSGFVARCWY